RAENFAACLSRPLRDDAKPQIGRRRLAIAVIHVVRSCGEGHRVPAPALIAADVEYDRHLRAIEYLERAPYGRCHRVGVVGPLRAAAAVADGSNVIKVAAGRFMAASTNPAQCRATGGSLPWVSGPTQMAARLCDESARARGLHLRGREACPDFFGKLLRQARLRQIRRCALCEGGVPEIVFEVMTRQHDDRRRRGPRVAANLAHRAPTIDARHLYIP